MERRYVKAFFDWVEQMSALEDDERGRLFVAILEYARSGEMPPMEGRESILFPVFKAQIDRDMETSRRQAENGKKGGRPNAEKGTKQNQTKPNKTKDNQTAEHEKPTKANKDKDKEEDKDKDKDILHPSDYRPQDVCPELSPSSAPEPAPAIELPLNDGTFFPISQEQCHEWAGLYPAVDVIQQLRNMRGWLDSNPRNRKTKSGIMKFANSWLAREQNQARTVQKSARVSMGPSPAHQMSPVGADDVERIFRELGRPLPTPPAEGVG